MVRNMKEWQKKIISTGTVGAMPIMTYPGLTLTGQSIIQAATSGKSQAACMEALADRYPSIASASMMDLSVEAEAFGSQAIFSETEAPTIVGKIITDQASADRLIVPPIGSGRTAAYLEAVSIAARHIHDRPVLGGQIGPFSLTSRLMEMKPLLLNIRRNPALVHTVLGKATDFLVQYAKAIKAEGANGVIIAEPAAGLVSPTECDIFSSVYVKRIVSAVQDAGFTVVLHNCGNTVPLVESMVSTGAAGFHFGNAVRMSQVAARVPSDRLVMGNIDPAGVLKIGTAEDVRRKTLELLEETGYSPSFVLSSGCDIPPGASLGNIDAFFGAVEEFNGYREKKAS